MTFTIHPLEEKDTLEWCHIHYEAFHTFLGCLWNSPPSEESFVINAASRAKSLTDPNVHVIKAVDSESGKIAGVAMWSLYTHERTAEELEKSLQDPVSYPEVNAEARAAFFVNLAHARRTVLGLKPCGVLSVLVVRPEFQKRGVGNLLVDWGTKEMDRLGLPGYLESSINGLALYKKFGYERHSEIFFDKTRYGGDGIDVHTIMLRPARSSSGIIAS